MISKKLKIISLKVPFLIIICTIISYLILIANQLLVAQDNIKKSDIIIVPTGEPQIRVPHAVDLYHDGFAPKILFVNSFSSHNGNDSKIYKKEDELIGKAYINRRIATKLGVPEENIIILNNNAKNTLEEAVIFGEYLKNHPGIDSVILVTSTFHSGRSKKIFKKVLKTLDRKIEIYSSPSKYDDSNVNRWWTNGKDILWVFREYLSLIIFYIRSLFMSF